jgi:hypothetical protein
MISGWLLTVMGMRPLVGPGPRGRIPPHSTPAMVVDTKFIGLEPYILIHDEYNENIVIHLWWSTLSHIFGINHVLLAQILLIPAPIIPASMIPEPLDTLMI